MVETPYMDTTPNLSARSYASLVISPPLSRDDQEKLVVRFNSYLNDKRETYHSLFLSNYRESIRMARKRISFQLAFNLYSFLLK